MNLSLRPISLIWFRSMQFFGKEPIESMDGLVGQNIRSWSPELSMWIELLGGTPVSISYAEAATAFATGLAQGVVSGVTSGFDGGWFDFLKVIQMWEYGYSQCFVLTNKEALAELDEATRDAFLGVTQEYAPLIQAGLPGSEDTNLRRAVVEYGVTVYPVDPELRAKMFEKCKTEIWPIWLERAGADGQKAYDILLEGLAALE